jgi:membrane protease YdiL (CAAX protease family)
MEPETLPPATVEPPQPPATDSPETAFANQPPRPIANVWHTAIFIVVLLAFSYSGSNGQHQAAAKHGKSYLYLFTIAWEWIMVLYIWLGTRRRGIGLRELIGGNEALDRLMSRGMPEWSEMKSGTRRVLTTLIDIGCGFGLWIGAALIIALVAKLMGMHPDAQQKIGFIAPRTGKELALFLVLSATAGVCEEIIFRGYLQRQFSILSRVAAVGIVVQAIIFGASHGYEGLQSMFLIALLGASFGVFTYFRKSVKPAMVAHFCQDGAAGIVLYLLANKIISLPK